MCGDATNWDEEYYRESILKERESQTLTVFRTAWAPPTSSTDSVLVAAASDGSIASYSISKLLSPPPPPLGFNHFRAPQIEPNGLIRGHDGPVYDVKFYENALLLSCGDDGRIRGWRWKEFAESEVPVFLQGNHVKPVIDLVNPQHRGPWGALSPIPENNSIDVDIQDGSIFSASGDSCAYSWDVESGKIKTIFRGHSDYLHCIVARSCMQQIITGSEDGTARIWDCRSGKCIQVIDPNKDKKLKVALASVRCIALDASTSWLACSSGRNLSIWNVTASEWFSSTSCHASIQDVAFDRNQILAVGGEPQLTRFNINGGILTQIPCAPQSSFSVSLHGSGLVAVGGCGGLVDVISQFGSHYCTFRCGYA